MLSFKEFIDKYRKIPVGIVIHDKRLYHSIYEQLLEFISSKYDELERELKSNYQFTPEQQNQLENYSNKSFELNAYLLGHHHTNETPVESPSFANGQFQYHLPTIDQALSKPLNRHMNVYSGLNFDATKNADKNGLIHFPSYTSTTIDPVIAPHFAQPQDNIKHILQIHLKPNDKGAYISNPGVYGDEREFLLPRNTTLKITHRHSDQDNSNHVIHHAEIVHDINPNDIERNPSRLRGLHPSFLEFYKNDPQNSKKVRNAATNPYIV